MDSAIKETFKKRFEALLPNINCPTCCTLGNWRIDKIETPKSLDSKPVGRKTFTAQPSHVWALMFCLHCKSVHTEELELGN